MQTIQRDTVNKSTKTLHYQFLKTIPNITILSIIQSRIVVEKVFIPDFD